MITAIILAGGSGLRMEREIPKQFIDVFGKPILAYTIERFEKHPSIDQIVVVCVRGWENYTREMAIRFGFSKLKKVVTGGDSALSSIKIGVNALQCQNEDIIVIHDGVRPLVNALSIDEVIKDCKDYGGAMSSVPLIEHVVYEGSNRTDLHYISREKAFRAVTPQAYKYEILVKAFNKSAEKGIGERSAFIGTLMMDLGEKVCLSKGSEKNIKITDPKDLIYFQTMLDQNEEINHN